MFENCLEQLLKKYIHHRRELLINKLESGDPLSDSEKQEHRLLVCKNLNKSYILVAYRYLSRAELVTTIGGCP